MKVIKIGMATLLTPIFIWSSSYSQKDLEVRKYDATAQIGMPATMIEFGGDKAPLCKLAISNDGKYFFLKKVNSTCKKYVSRSGKKIICTSNKAVCKTRDELKEVIKDTQKGTKAVIDGLEYTTDKFLAVRDKPRGKLLGKLYDGNKVTILATRGKWYNIKRESDGLSGWAYHKWIKIEKKNALKKQPTSLKTSSTSKSKKNSSLDGDVYPLSFMECNKGVLYPGIKDNKINLFCYPKTLYKISFNGKKEKEIKFKLLKKYDGVKNIEIYNNSYYIATYERQDIVYDKSLKVLKSYTFYKPPYKENLLFFKDNNKDYAILRGKKNKKKFIDIMEYDENNNSKKITIQDALTTYLLFAPVKTANNEVLIFSKDKSSHIKINQLKKGELTTLYTFNKKDSKHFSSLIGLFDNIFYTKKEDKIYIVILKKEDNTSKNRLKIGIVDLKRKKFTIKDYGTDILGGSGRIDGFVILPTNEIIVYGAYLVEKDFKYRSFIALFDKDLKFILKYIFSPIKKDAKSFKISHIYLHKDKIFFIEEGGYEKDREKYFLRVLPLKNIEYFYGALAIKKISELIDAKTTKAQKRAFNKLKEFYNLKGKYIENTQVKYLVGSYIAEAYFKGHGTVKDLKKAKEYGLKACNNKVGDGCLVVAKVNIAKNNEKEALKYASLACNYGDKLGCVLKERIKKFIKKKQDAIKRAKEEQEAIKKAQEEARRAQARRASEQKNISVKFHGYTGYHKSPTYDLFINGEFDGMIFYYPENNGYVILTTGIKKGRGINGNFTPSIKELYTAQCGRTKAYDIKDALNKAVKCIYNERY